MPSQTFIADSAADALVQIRQQLGPDAVVLNVRQISGPGISRLWQKPRIEVIAHVPEAPAAVPKPAEDGLFALKREIAEIRSRLEVERRMAAPAKPLVPVAEPAVATPPREPEPAFAATARSPSDWRIIALLKRSGLLQPHVQRVADELQSHFGPKPPAALADELAAAQRVLASLWREAPAPVLDPGRPHVFLGTPGCGKTTVLCKWLAQTVLLEGRAAHVWRLDGSSANTAEALSVYGEILGVPVARFWRGVGEAEGAEVSFIDLPGFAPGDETACAPVRQLLRDLPGAQVHLVINAAYEVPLLLRQLRGLTNFGYADLIVTHLDEETRWGKLWNLTLGTNIPVGFLSAGQNIPGEFLKAAPEKIFTRQFA